MDIARLGVVIDPTAAEQGGRRAQEAIKRIGQEARQSLGQVDTASDKAGRSVGRMATTTKRGFGDMASMVVNFLDALGLLNGSFGQLIRRSESVVTSGSQIAKAMAEAGEAAGDTAGIVENLTEATGNLGGASGNMGAMFQKAIPWVIAAGIALAGVLVTIGLLVAAFQLLKKAVNVSAEMEQFELRLAVSMGSFTKAREKLKELSQFAADTPFTDEEIFNAGVKLEAMTEGALSTKEALMAIGGASVVAGKSFDEMADLAGRAFNAIKLGMDYIEPLKTMFSYGLISGETVKQVIALGDEAEKAGNKGANAAQQWALVYDDLAKKQVALALLSDSWNGKLSTISGMLDQLLARLGAPVRDALKPILDDLISIIGLITPIVETVGIGIATSIRMLYEAFSNGELWALIGTALASEVEGFLDLFVDGWTSVAKWMGGAVMDALGEAADAVANAFMQAFVVVVNFLAEKLSELVKMAAPILAPLGFTNVSFSYKASAETIDAFKPENKKLGDIYDENVGAGGMVGTYWRDKFSADGKRLMEQSFKRNPGSSDSDLPPKSMEQLLEELGMNNGGGGGSGGGGKGATEKMGDSFLETAVATQLAKEEEAVQESYEKRREIILENTQLTEEQQTDLMTRLAEDRAKSLEAIEQKRLEAHLSQASEFFGHLATLSRSSNKTLAAIGKAAAIAQATINTYLAASKALAEGGPYAGPIMAAAITVAGMAQVANIASTEANYAMGGIVPGNSYNGDNVKANVNSGEMILNRAQQAQLFAMANGRGGQSGGGGRTTINVHNNAGARVTEKESAMGDDRQIDFFIDKVERRLADRIQTGGTPLPLAIQRNYRGIQRGQHA